MRKFSLLLSQYPHYPYDTQKLKKTHMLKKLYQHRRYILENAWTDIRYRYAGTGLGIFWNIFNPLLEVAIYTFVFSQIINLRSGGDRGTAYVLFLCAGLFPWFSFSETLMQGSNAFQENASYLRRLPIHPAVFVTKYAVTSCINLLIYMVLLFLLAVFMDISPHWTQLLVMPLGLLLQAMAFGLTLILANIRFLISDVKEVMGAVIHLWRWLLPIVYTEDIIPVKFLSLFRLNPPYYFIQSFRMVFLDHQVPEIKAWLTMLAWAAFFIALGGFVSEKLSSDVRDNL